MFLYQSESDFVHPIHIDNLSNSNVQQIERFTSVEQAMVIMREFIRSYCRLIRGLAMTGYSPLVQKALNCIFTDLSADLSLSSLAAILNVNASYLSTLFKKEIGSSLTEYVNRSRIRHAQHLLLETNLPIKIIAQQCGIKDVYYFGRLFKKITGTSPKAYRDDAMEHYLKLITDPEDE
ncbi:MAG: helix-turn-helix domain-containing protein [Clostridiales bacterium]|nr:helix-turn-helix domain-containing protein [Clostridiales bacterium]